MLPLLPNLFYLYLLLPGDMRIYLYGGVLRDCNIANRQVLQKLLLGFEKTHVDQLSIFHAAPHKVPKVQQYNVNLHVDLSNADQVKFLGDGLP